MKSAKQALFIFKVSAMTKGWCCQQNTVVKDREWRRQKGYIYQELQTNHKTERQSKTDASTS